MEEGGRRKDSGFGGLFENLGHVTAALRGLRRNDQRPHGNPTVSRVGDLETGEAAPVPSLRAVALPAAEVPEDVGPQLQGGVAEQVAAVKGRAELVRGRPPRPELVPPPVLLGPSRRSSQLPTPLPCFFPHRGLPCGPQTQSAPHRPGDPSSPRGPLPAGA